MLKLFAVRDYANTETGEVTRRLVAAQFCRDRLCPMCAWRKSLVMFSQISQIMDWVAEREETVPIFLTLTVGTAHPPSWMRL